MNIKIDSDFRFSVASIQYTAAGEVCISLTSGDSPSAMRYQYTANLGNCKAEEKPTVSLLQYARDFAASANIKYKTWDSYRLMCNHLEAYGDCPMDKVTTAYIQEFITFLQCRGLRPGTVRLYLQKLACVLHDAYKNGLFDDRILQRVKRPKREHEKKCFLSETELKKLTRHQLSKEYDNIQKMFLFSCMTGLRYSDIRGLRWKDVKRSGKHLLLEFHQQKTDTYERLPLCAEAEALLHSQKRSGEYVFKEEANQRVNVVLKRWCKEAKIKKPVSFHSARHTFCVLLLTKEVPIYTVQQLMCHSDIGTTKVYADLLNKTKAKALRKLPRLTTSAVCE
ncbi:MAG: site-specific integrase [Bacteroidales bacterium]|nr:site-specific integrase [Bacteroidales bacterium]